MRVRAVNKSTAGTATRARAHIGSRALRNSRTKLDRYAAPRKAAVSAGLIVQANNVSVRSGNRNSSVPLMRTKALAT